MVSYGHIRTKYAPDWKEKFGGTDDMVKQTGIIGVTEGIYNDMIAYSKTSELMQDADFRQALVIPSSRSQELMKAKTSSKSSVRSATSGAMTRTMTGNAPHRKC